MNYLLEALCKKLEGEMAVAHANVKAYERNVVGIIGFYIEQWWRHR